MKVAGKGDGQIPTGQALVDIIRQLEADDKYDSPEYEDLLSRRRAEIEAAHVRPRCCEAAGKAIRFSLDVGDCEDTDLVKTGRWTIGAHEIAFCPFCSRRLPEMQRKSTGKTCRVTDGGYYCAVCNKRLQECLCDPMDAAFGPVLLTDENIVRLLDEMRAIADLDGSPICEHAAINCPFCPLPDRQPLKKYMTNDSITFAPTSKVWLATSHKPGTGKTDDGIWHRFIASLPKRIQRDTFSMKPPHVVPLRLDTVVLRLAMYLALEWTL